MANITVYAKWRAAVAQHNLTINKNDGTAAETIQVDTGTTLSTLLQLDTPSKTGYTFGGWYTDEDCTVAMPATMPDSNLTVYAKWTINRYVVRFRQVENGNVFATETYDYNSTIPENYGNAYQTREGYVFKGWRYRDSLGNIHEFVRGESGTRIVADTDVFGEWNPIYTVTFVPERGIHV